MIKQFGFLKIKEAKLHIAGLWNRKILAYQF